MRAGQDRFVPISQAKPVQNTPFSSGLQRSARDSLPCGPPHPGPLPFERGEGEAAADQGVVHAADPTVCLGGWA